MFLKISQNVQKTSFVLLKEVAGIQFEILSKKRIQCRSCLLNFAKFVRTSVLLSTSWQLLLEEHWALPQMVPIAIANNISKANYEAGFALYVFGIKFG